RRQDGVDHVDQMHLALRGGELVRVVLRHHELDVLRDRAGGLDPVGARSHHDHCERALALRGVAGGGGSLERDAHRRGLAGAVVTPSGPALATTTATVPWRSAASRAAAALSSAPSIAEDRLVASSTEYNGYASSRAPGVSKKLGSDPVASTRIRPRYVSPSSV